MRFCKKTEKVSESAFYTKFPVYFSVFPVDFLRFDDTVPHTHRSDVI